jgi:L-threonine-O-3-phosphate decarboxylase
MSHTTASQATLVPHGTLDYAEARALGVHPADLIVFSSNINPYGPPPAVLDALRAACTADIVARYPDRLSLDLRDGLAALHAVDPAHILVGNGTADILWLIGLCYLRGRRVAILGPTFGEYENAARIMGATVLNIPLPGWARQADSVVPGATTLQETATALAAAMPDAVFLCNPNNPDGQYLPPDGVAHLRAAAPDALWIVDEAYADFMDAPATAIRADAEPRLLVLRSMTKDFALGGLRLGYVVGEPALIEPLQTMQPPWNVNAFAHAAGLACLHETGWRRRSLAQLRADCAELRQALAALGFAPQTTTVAYFLVPVTHAPALRSALLAQKLVVRDCTSFGLPRHIRIAARKPHDNRRLTDALAQLTHYAAPAV